MFNMSEKSILHVLFPLIWCEAPWLARLAKDSPDATTPWFCLMPCSSQLLFFFCAEVMFKDRVAMMFGCAKVQAERFTLKKKNLAFGFTRPRHPSARRQRQQLDPDPSSTKLFSSAGGCSPSNQEGRKEHWGTSRCSIPEVIMI